VSEILDMGARGWVEATGLQIVNASGDEVTGTLVVVPEKHMQPFGLLHGGVLCGIVESLASVGAAIYAMEHGKVGSAGMENHTSFLRSVRGGVLTGRAFPLHRGGSTHVWEVHITDEEGRLVARGTVRLAILDKR
jgi:1,4-dihydroxy-2-naphthoyl-CoA hydrolase